MPLGTGFSQKANRYSFGSYVQDPTTMQWSRDAQDNMILNGPQTGQSRMTLPLDKDNIGITTIVCPPDLRGVLPISFFDYEPGKNYFGWFWVIDADIGPGSDPLPTKKGYNTPSGVIWGGGANLLCDVGDVMPPPGTNPFSIYYYELQPGKRYGLCCRPDIRSGVGGFSFRVYDVRPASEL